jgi:uncharacterized membrane protein YphA (DoxX/SURF4 family)
MAPGGSGTRSPIEHTGNDFHSRFHAASNQQRSTPLAAARRYYPGFFGALFLVLLRIAIGWHFLYEGLEKIESTQKGGRPFTAEPYLRASTGPLAPYFRGLVPDVNSLAMLDPARLKAAWAVDVERIADHYGFDNDQREQAAKELRQSEEFADIWFSDREKAEDRKQYIDELREVQAIERNLGALSYQRERAAAKRKDLDADRKALIADLQGRGGALRDAVIRLATPDQREAAGPYAPPRTQLDQINMMTMYGLVAMGLCLMLGFLTPLAALAGAVFLGQIYFSMPPWPGLPPNPMAEGHYFIVNKNLIEMLACLALAFIPTGNWVGLDSLVFGWMFRRRETTDTDTPPRTSPGTGASNSTSSGRTAPADVKPIPLSSPGLSKGSEPR